MSYSALYTKKNKRIYSILGVLSFLSLFIGGLVFVNQWGRQNGWQKTIGINRLYVVNRSAHGFEVLWSTKKLVKDDQWVEVGLEKGNYPIKSKFENIGEVNLATIGGLKADTTYYFRVRVGTQTYILPSLISDVVHTPKEVREKPISPAYGKVILPSTRPYANGLLIYEIDGYYPFAVFTKETGEWLLPLTGLVEKKSNTITSVADSALVSIKLFSYPEGTVRASVGQTRPLRQVIAAGISANIAQTTQGKGESVLGSSSQNSVSQTNNSPSITYPKENALIPGNTPLIRGTANRGANITVLIQATTKQYSYRTTADEKGDWLIQYPLVLEPGKYTIFATIENKNASSTFLRRTFSIIKSGEQVLGVATGTPTLIPTPTLTNNPYPTAIIPTRFVPTSTPPVSGGGMSIFLFGALFCIVIGAGLVLAF